jgi:hypothetical protein
MLEILNRTKEVVTRMFECNQLRIKYIQTADNTLAFNYAKKLEKIKLITKTLLTVQKALQLLVAIYRYQTHPHK